MHHTSHNHFAAWMATGILLGAGSRLAANPSGLTVKSGTATTQTTGSQLTVTTGALTVLNWASFNIQGGETTTFIQPSASSVVFNSIGGSSPSQIFGRLNANGTVILANAHGFYFGPNSFINVGGNFIATTAPLPVDPGLGGNWTFTGAPPLAGIVNYGQISVGQGHSLFLIAEDIENHGALAAPEGGVGLYGGESVLLSERADGRGLSATVKLPAGTINNLGQITADAGTIALDAQVVNQNGLIQADSVREQNGTVELLASGQLTLGPNSQILARGDNFSPGSPGGTVTLKSGNSFADSPGSQINASGGTQGGEGGLVDVSAPNISSLNSTMAGGQLLLDPANITLGTTGSGSAGNGVVTSGNGAGTLALNVNSAFANKNFPTITLQATANITLSSGAVWNLSSSTGETGGLLTLQAGGNIVFGNNSEILDANNWSVNLQAGVNFATGSVQSGTGSIYLSGGPALKQGGSVQTSKGDINMTAGEDILLGTGGIRTMGGGNINLQALAGNVNAGTGNGGYNFAIFGSTVSSAPGGIATAAGGNVTLQAGNEIISTPTVPAGQPPGASGAYGNQPGNVTLIAGNQILGNYTVANGTGTMLAGVEVQNGQVSQILNPTANIGSATSPVALSLIAGSWNAWAANNIYLQEVRNPDGAFNFNQTAVPAGVFPGDTGNSTIPANSTFVFNYAPNAAVNLWAGDGITLAGNNLPRVLGYNQNMPPIYPPILTLNAGAGGITVDNSIILYPSTQGTLQINTVDGGNLVGAFQGLTLTGITMSDSGLPGYADFLSGHAAVPLHIDDPNPVTVSVSGDIESFGLTVPTYAQITVSGSTYNFGFQGQNILPSQATYINVAGDLTYRSDATSVALATPLPATLLNPLLSGNQSVTENLQYDATTGTLSFHGVMTAADLAFLLNPYELVLGPSGKPEVNAAGLEITKPLPLTPDQQSAIQQLYTESQTATLGAQGLSLSGSGLFAVNAARIDLGTSGGIQVLTPSAALAVVSPDGANLVVTTTGALEMTSSKIVNEGWHGGVQLNVGTDLDVGDEFTAFGDPSAAKGIFTTSGGAVSIATAGNINVDGSRVATYDGGNISIRSATGDVDAGTGGVGYVSVQGVELNPKNDQLTPISATIAGSGILATTMPRTHATLGNINIDTPEGSINTSKGGIIQVALNGANSQNNSITLTAGKDINASGSGIVGANLDINAAGNINGILVGTGNIAVQSQANVNVTAFGRGDVSISASGEVSGTVITSGTADVSGQSIGASLISQSVSTSGSTTASTIGVPASNAPKPDSKVADDASTAVANAEQSSDENDPKKKSKTITLAQRTGRVTVLTRGKNNTSRP